ncbi:UNVERIFIED_CONTAM: protein MAEA [Sesamum calycinum]|uniref:Protein MAEA n=1 Tax=Sesamum calycinum TaxID=2727403 RepID=A0AAW2K1L5_9LAMI
MSVYMFLLFLDTLRFCYEDDCTKEDPLSQEGFRKLAQPLPYSKQHHSKLVCYISKELMDTENPPLVLPNGYVYSTKALEDMAKQNHGKITCPRTGLVCDYTDVVKAFIS